MNAFKRVVINGINPPKNDKNAIAIVIIIPPLNFLNIKNFVSLVYYRFGNMTICFFKIVYHHSFYLLELRNDTSKFL